MYIATIDKSFGYTFSFHKILNLDPYSETHDLRVSLDHPVSGMTYTLSTRAEDIEAEKSRMLCTITKQDSARAPLFISRYIPHPAKRSITITVHKVEKNPINDSDIVEGRIDGFLFSETDRQDSLAINADFRTILYDDI